MRKIEKVTLVVFFLSVLAGMVFFGAYKVTAPKNDKYEISIGDKDESGDRLNGESGGTEAEGYALKSYFKDYEFKFEEIREIESGLINADIDFIPSGNKNIIRVEISGEGKSLEYAPVAELKNGKLEINQRDNNVDIKINNFGDLKRLLMTKGKSFNDDLLKKYGRYNVKVYLASDYQKDIEISSVSGEVNIEDVECGNFSANMVSGDFKGRRLISKKSVFNGVSGKITVEEFSGNLNLSIVSGTAEFIYHKFDNNMDLDTVSGDITVKMKSSEKFALRFDSISGKLINDFKDSVSDDASNKLDIGSVSGNVSILRL